MITGHAVDACIYLWIGYLTSFILRSATAGFRAQWLIPGQPGPREAIQQISVKSRHLNPKIHWLTVSDSLACSSRPAWALNLNQLPEMVGYGDPARGQVRKLLRDESVKFEQIPLFYPRGCAAPLREIAPITALERFVVYCSYKQIISGPGRGPEDTRNCSSCYSVEPPGPGLRAADRASRSHGWYVIALLLQSRKHYGTDAGRRRPPGGTAILAARAAAGRAAVAILVRRRPQAQARRRRSTDRYNERRQEKRYCKAKTWKKRYYKAKA